MKNNATFAGAVATVLFAGTLAVLVAVAIFGLFRIGEQSLEALGYLPLRWGENNLDLMLEISVVAAAPLVMWFVLWFFKLARAAEAGLIGYKYNPPSAK